MSTKQDEINAVLAKHGLTVESVFVPWSQSRNAGEKQPSLNWRVTLLHNGKKILTTDYGAGMGHCPSYKSGNPFRMTVDQMAAIKAECERGTAQFVGSLGAMARPGLKKILPDSRDVIYSLLMDSEVIDYPSFEEWARDFGYDEDSRKDEAVYNACMKIALQFRRIGESVIAELREVYQDY